jgi:hypothetical protein
VLRRLLSCPNSEVENYAVRGTRWILRSRIRIGHLQDTGAKLTASSLPGFDLAKLLELLKLAERQGFEPWVQVLARTTV